jgi:hypothetical protein
VHNSRISEHLHTILKKLAKKDRSLYEQVLSKIEEITQLKKADDLKFESAEKGYHNEIAQLRTAGEARLDSSESKYLKEIAGLKKSAEDKILSLEKKHAAELKEHESSFKDRLYKEITHASKEMRAEQVLLRESMKQKDVLLESNAKEISALKKEFHSELKHKEEVLAHKYNEELSILKQALAKEHESKIAMLGKELESKFNKTLSFELNSQKESLNTAHKKEMLASKTEYDDNILRLKKEQESEIPRIEKELMHKARIAVEKEYDSKLEQVRLTLKAESEKALGQKEREMISQMKKENAEYEAKLRQKAEQEIQARMKAFKKGLSNLMQM